MANKELTRKVQPLAPMAGMLHLLKTWSVATGSPGFVTLQAGNGVLKVFLIGSDARTVLPCCVAAARVCSMILCWHGEMVVSMFGNGLG